MISIDLDSDALYRIPIKHQLPICEVWHLERWNSGFLCSWPALHCFSGAVASLSSSQYLWWKSWLNWRWLYLEKSCSWYERALYISTSFSMRSLPQLRCGCKKSRINGCNVKLVCLIIWNNGQQNHHIPYEVVSRRGWKWIPPVSEILLGNSWSVPPVSVSYPDFGQFKC